MSRSLEVSIDHPWLVIKLILNDDQGGTIEAEDRISLQELKDALNDL